MPIPDGVLGGPAQLTWYIGQDKNLYAHELQTDGLFAISEEGAQGPPGPQGPPGIAEAPADDQTYGRQNSDWTLIPAIPTAGVVIHTIQPVSAAESTSVQITVNGTGFTSTSVVNWGGFPLATTFVSDTVLEATLNLGPGSSGIYTVWVTEGSLLSNSVAFTVSIDGTTFAKNGGPSCTLDINLYGDLILTQKTGPNAGKTVNLTYGKWS